MMKKLKINTEHARKFNTYTSFPGSKNVLSYDLAGLLTYLNFHGLPPIAESGLWCKNYTLQLQK